MNLISEKHSLSGHITVPGSKSHTIRALVLASLAEGTSVIKNPLASNDCKSAAKAIQKIGAKISGFPEESVWTVTSSAKDLHLPDDIIDVENSGSTLYFFAPICATYPGISVFTGDSSIRKRPVLHLIDALNQLGAQAKVTQPGKNAPPFVVSGPIKSGKVVTDGKLSQYISGLMMASTQIEGTTQIELTDPKEVPYLSMTKWWLNNVGVNLKMSDDYKHIEVTGVQKIHCFEQTIPSDWEGVAFPLIASLISKSDIYTDNIDTSGTQGDEKIVDILKSVGAKIEYEESSLHVFGSKSVLSTKHLENGELHVKLADFPDAICALAVIACFVDGKTILEDIEICRKKETDRIVVMEKELSKLGASVKDTGDTLTIQGVLDGANLKGGLVHSYDDHRVAMSLSCIGLGLPAGEKIEVNGAECCSVSFPGYVEKMNGLGCGFKTV